MNWHGAIAGVITGGLAVLAWKQLEGGIFALYEIVPGVLLATLAIVVVSLLTAPPGQASRELFARYRVQLRQHER